ncbi:MAG: hypothetical protein HY209_06100 [Candidatus Omnitrophica bacterium]|nr:hypothetical protein [Candidatus Omnitrophota bacterium]
MAPERSITPEKQLLRLIEEHKVQRNTATLQVQALKYHNLSFLSLGAWVGRLSFSKDWLQKRLHGVRGQPFDIKIINQAAVVCIYILAVYFSFNFISSLVDLWRIPNLEIKSSEKIRPLSFRENSVLKTVASSYLEKVRERDLFKIGKGTDRATENKEVKGPSSQVIEASGNLKLVGISWSSDPDAIVEDTKATKTFFVKVGHTIGEGKVQAIFKDRVILRYGDEEIELK